jgi:hypothetical protein
MPRDRLNAVLLIGAAATIGWASWSGHVLALPLSVAFPSLWSMARNRVTAGLVSIAYFLAASRGLPQGVAAYYGSDLWPGLLLWLTASSALIFVHSVLWTSRPGWPRSLRYLTACGLMVAPPFGILGWANPLTAAGVLFPGWGLFGLAFTAAGLAAVATDLRPAAALAFAGFWLWSTTHWTAPLLPGAWYAVDLKLGAYLGRDDSLLRQRHIAAAPIERWKPGDRVAVLPESALGFWTPTTERFWQRRLAGTGLTIVAGASDLGRAGYDNALVAITEAGGRVLYRQRMPVPGSMWQPWRVWLGESGGARAHIFANPVVTVGGSSVAPLICYEQLLVWPVLQSMLHNPDLIVAVGNDWWATGTSIVDIQRASTEAWARLFNKPLVISFNT